MPEVAGNVTRPRTVNSSSRLLTSPLPWARRRHNKHLRLEWEVVMPTWVQYVEWLISAPVLIAIAWVRFNSPPTNRSGTTFVLFFVGLTFYCLLIVALWLLIIVAVSEGGIGLGEFYHPLPGAKAQGDLAQHAPLVAAFILVAATHFSWVCRMDNSARSLCITLAAIPREADWLALELAQNVDFSPKSEVLRSKVSKIISERIGPQALSFEA